MKREEQMMNAAEAYAAGCYADEPVSFSTEENICETINDFCAGWRAADRCPQWIPVEERLPKRMSEKSRFSETVLVYNKAGFKDVTYYDFVEKTWKWAPCVTHWMKIVPPKEGGDHDK
jgi:hypothetical protein